MMFLSWWAIVVIGIIVLYVIYSIIRAVTITRASRKIFNHKFEENQEDKMPKS